MSKYNVLLLGSGGREHALAWKISQSEQLGQLFTMPGNPGTALFGRNLPGDILDSSVVLAAAQRYDIDLVFIGPEAPLESGVSDSLRQHGFMVFGPSSGGAMLETSKVYAKSFMDRRGIPTAQFTVLSDLPSAVEFIKVVPYPYVIKVSGLAAGKGVFLPDTFEEARQILEDILVNKIFGAAGGEVVIEERLFGIEVSLMAFADGVDFVLMPPAQDHKRQFDNDKGPNTGGMGVFAPSPFCTQEHLQAAVDRIIKPTIAGMAEAGKPYRGVLYAGLMLTSEGPKLLEYNCRFGDPETQVILPLLDGDLIEIGLACDRQGLKALSNHIAWRESAANCVVLASGGYPGPYQKGHPIHGLDEQSEGSIVFHAGTKDVDGTIVTNGGRVLGVTALGETLQDAVDKSYKAVKRITFEGMQYRTDIGKIKTAYQTAGVSIEAGNRSVDLIKNIVARTHGDEVLSGVGSFGGLFAAGALKAFDDPVLVASTDGVGTKVILAAQLGRLRSIGHDIVNHCVNDILVQGARPLFFMDYFASDRLVPEDLVEVVTGISEACQVVGCALLGGETAEMPGVYRGGHFDLVGTIVGVVERQRILPVSTIKPGDLLYGLASSGPHTNGYSLIRSVFQLGLDQTDPGLGLHLGDALLAPHRSYFKSVYPLLSLNPAVVKGLVHITGGGFYDNIPRVLPDGLGARIEKNSWLVPDIFSRIQAAGAVDSAEMYHVFNMGVGMVVIVDHDQAGLFEEKFPETAWLIGKVVEGEGVVIV